VSWRQRRKAKKLLLIGAALWVLFYASGAHAIDMCRERDSRCSDENGKTCYKLSNCCKIAHDWATQIRDETVCKRKPKNPDYPEQTHK